MNYDGVFTLTKFYENRGEWVPVGATYDEEKAVAWQNQDPDKYGLQNQSRSSLYHLAGDSIVVDVLMNIFSEML